MAVNARKGFEKANSVLCTCVVTPYSATGHAVADPYVYIDPSWAYASEYAVKISADETDTKWVTPHRTEIDTETLTFISDGGDSGGPGGASGGGDGDMGGDGGGDGDAGDGDAGDGDGDAGDGDAGDGDAGDGDGDGDGAGDGDGDAGDGDGDGAGDGDDDASGSSSDKSSDGCGCRIAGGENGSHAPWPLALLGLAFVRLRRRVNRGRTR